MKVRTRIFALMTGASAVFLVAALTMVRVESERAAELIASQKEEKDRYTKRIVQLRGESLETYARDYTIWDEMCDAIRKPDLKWLDGNLTTSFDTYGAEVVWVYNPAQKVVYHHALHDAENAAPPQIDWVLSDPPKSGKTWHFFIQTKKGPLEIRGSTVHGTTDLDRNTVPSGYFFVGRMWTRGFLGKLEEVADAGITLSANAKTPPDQMHAGLFFSSIPLPGFDGKPVEYAVFATKRPTWSLLHDSATRSIIGYLAYAALLLGVLAFCLYRWVSRPLQSIASSLETDQPAPLDTLKTWDEFGEIASLIRTFFRQRSELKAEVRSRELAERELRAGLAEVLEARRLAVNQTRQLESQTIQLEGARDAALEAVRQKGEFLAYMSHEIRNPLGGIKGVAELLLETGLDTRQRDYTRTIAKSADSLLEMLNGILDLSKAENGKIELEEVDFCLEDVIDDVGDLMAPRAIEKGIDFDVYIDPTVPAHLKGDPGRVRQVVTNLISNAIKFTERGSVDVEVRSGGTEGGSARLVIVVSDTGVGIPADRLDAVFEQYTQAESSTSRRFGGTGLGLSICKQLVELMGGSIEVASEIGKGTTFTVRLRIPAPMTGEPGSDAHLVGRGFRILVLGQDSRFRERLVTRLEHCGFGVVATSDAAAIDAGDRPHAAIVDDERLGPAAERILSRLITSGMPHVRIQSHADGAGADSAITVGLTRPVRTADLLAAIERVLKGRTAAEAVAPEGDRPLKGVRVLVAEDDRVNQMVAQRLLESMACEVTIVPNGRLAVEAVRERRWDIVFMDCHMPEMGGIEAASEIRAMEGDLGWRVPIVALSATSTLDEQEQCMAWGMDDCLLKPATAAKLRETILKWVPSLHRAA